MKIVIPGGSGQVGAVLTRSMVAAGHKVVILSRRAAPTVPPQNQSRLVQWDGKSSGRWQDEISGADVVINLAGRSVNCRYHQRNRQAIHDSRVDSTRAVGKAIANADKPPRLWLQASTATIYAHRYDAPNDEFTGVLGGNAAEKQSPISWQFSIEVANAWEQACMESTTEHTRKVLLRSAMTMSPDLGGVFDALLRLVRFGLGGSQGDGRQFVSWVHDLDFTRAIDWIVEHDDLSGVVNIASPNPLPNSDFMRALRDAWGTRVGLPATKWMIEIGAFLLRTETELILKSRRVVPGQLLQQGFEFRYPSWPQAAADLVDRWRACHRPG